MSKERLLLLHNVLSVPTGPLAVTELQSTATDSSSVALTWTPDAGSQQDSYQIRHHGSNQATGWSSVSTSTDPEKSVSDLFPGDTYTFEVKAVSGTEMSSEKTATAVLCKFHQ